MLPVAIQILENNGFQRAGVLYCITPHVSHSSLAITIDVVAGYSPLPWFCLAVLSSRLILPFCYPPIILYQVHILAQDK